MVLAAAQVQNNYDTFSLAANSYACFHINNLLFVFFPRFTFSWELVWRFILHLNSYFWGVIAFTPPPLEIMRHAKSHSQHPPLPSTVSCESGACVS